MKFHFIALFVLILTFSAFSQEYPLVTIQDIQKHPDSLTADPPSLINGDTVRVRGVVMVSPVVNPSLDRRPIAWAGARWVTYIQTEDGQLWGGVNIVQQDTTAANQGTFFDLIDTAQVVEFTAVVTEFSTTTQLNILLNPISPVQVISSLPKRPDPIEVTISEFRNNNTYQYTGEKYEGMYVVIRNVITSNRNNSTGVFTFTDAEGNTMRMTDQSGYFTKRGHRLTGLTDYDAPLDGTVLEYIRGFVQSRNDGYYYIVPMYPGDMQTGATPPSITNLSRTNGWVEPNTPNTISSRIVDLDGTVIDAKVFYRINKGSYIEVPLVRGVADTNSFSATIPGVNLDSAIVDYFYYARDNEGRVSINPIDTARNRYAYPVLNRPLTIQDVQYSPFGSGFSNVNGYRVTVSGVVTADTSDIPGFGSSAPQRVYIQNGTGPWSGIWISGLQTLPLLRGDHVTVSGKVSENFNVTRLDSLTSLIINSTNNPLPDPVDLTTGSIGASADGSLFAESYESVLIRYNNPIITALSADGTANFGEINIDDGTGNTRVELQDGNNSYNNNWEPGLPGTQVELGAVFQSLTGVLYFSFSNYKLVPRKDSDFVGYTTSIHEGVSPHQFELSQNYPNPFNPATSINYSIKEAGNVKMEIYNLLGEKVKTIVDQYQEAGTFKVIFDASELNSGVYFYKLTSGSQNIIKKMMLVK
ncbi:MAG: T9SS type A sorting domain-containing protein [Ignavibacteriaceae bacterium]|nr:T9SS type A sorting domain-containing protein [Ignavibacteriaceae bacterium]